MAQCAIARPCLRAKATILTLVAVVLWQPASGGRPLLSADACNGNPCFPGTCTMRNEGTFICTCPEGYGLAPNNKACKDIDDCLVATHGESRCGDVTTTTCTNTPGSFLCGCADGYENYDAFTKRCTDIDECVSADVSVICTNTIGSFSEVCAPGYEGYDESNRKCTDIDECLFADLSVTCTNTPGGFEETCATGFENYDNVSRACSDIDECVNAQDSVICTNTLGSFVEICAPGYASYDNLTRTCSDVDECMGADESVICINTAGSFEETCREGFTDYNNLTRACRDIDECALVATDGSVDCINTVGAAITTCAPGYENFDWATGACSDIDECLHADASVACVNTPGSFTEYCAPGYVNYDPLTRMCTDLDECASIIDSLSISSCQNLPGGFSASCATGYFNLSASNMSCNCPYGTFTNPLNATLRLAVDPLAYGLLPTARTDASGKMLSYRKDFDVASNKAAKLYISTGFTNSGVPGAWDAYVNGAFVGYFSSSAAPPGVFPVLLRPGRNVVTLRGVVNTGVAVSLREEGSNALIMRSDRTWSLCLLPKP